MRGRLTILKLGGSAITMKGRERTPNNPAIRRLAREIAEASVFPLIIIHGGGSYGHPSAERYKIKGGFKEPSQLIGFSKTHEAMASLNSLVVNALISEGVPALGMPPSSFMVLSGGRLLNVEKHPLVRALEVGVTPVLYGDVAFDTDMGFTILSGDRIAASLAMRLGAQRIVVGVDVDGLYTDDPKLNPSARLIRHLTPKKLKDVEGKIRGSQFPDVTGGMLGKVMELEAAVKSGVEVIIVNALREGNIYKALRGEDVVGTKFTKE